MTSQVAHVCSEHGGDGFSELFAFKVGHQGKGGVREQDPQRPELLRHLSRPVLRVQVRGGEGPHVSQRWNATMGSGEETEVGANWKASQTAIRDVP